MQLSHSISSANQYTLDNSGYIVIPDVLSNQECNNYCLRLNEIYASLKSSNRNIYPPGVGTQERLILNLQNKDSLFLPLVDNQIILPYIHYMLTKGAYSQDEPYCLTQFSARDPHPHTASQQLHIDSRFPGSPYPLMVIALWALNDFDSASGSTRLVPGSHRRGSYPQNNYLYPDEISVNVRRGSVIIYNGSLWHGGGAKSVNIERWAIISSYSRWFVKPSFDIPKTFSPSERKSLSKQQLELFGFTTIPSSDEHERASTRTA